MARSGRLRSGAGAKLKRWRKGHSSDCNPETRQHRLAARSRFCSRPAERSNLTVDALKLHNELQSGSLRLERTSDSAQLRMEEDDIGEAATEKSSGTFLSGLSDCTNVTFSKVQRFWESNSAAHKEICAVLAAVTEVIRSRGGKESETEYFAALMTTLEAVESPESLAAVAYLLNLVLKRVPSPVLIKKFSDTSKAFMGIMSSQACSSSTSALRWVLSCLATLLRKQDLAAWSYPVTLQVYHSLLSFCVHTKPKVRKAAQYGVCSVLRGSEFMFGDAAPEHHPAAPSTAKFCVQEIEKAGGTKEATTTLHVLALLRDLLPCFPAAVVKTCCETLLRVMTLSHVLVTACAMQAFHSLFSAQASVACLPAELNAQIITALYDYVPSTSDLQPLLTWLSTMERAHVNLGRLQKDLCWAHLPRLFSAAMNCFLSPHSQVVAAAAQTLEALLSECIAPHMEDLGTVSASAPAPAAYLCKMFRSVEEGLTYRFHAAWDEVLRVLEVFFETCGKQCHPIMRKCLRSLCDLRLSPHFPYTTEVDQAVGAAVSTMGPEVLLEAVPLEIDGKEETLDFPRSWLLPVLRDYVQGARLGFFTSYFLPLAAALKSRALEFTQAGKSMEAKIYDTLQWQVWTLLPGFCTCPTDVLGAFKGLARTLGMAISERPDLRPTVCQALRTLIHKGCETDAERAEVGRFAKNFLPILFNVYSQPEEDGGSSAQRRSVLDTVRAYLTITDPQMVCGFLQKASMKLTSPESSEFARLSILDLVVAMAPYADEQSLDSLYHTIQPSLQSKERSMQKKAYRVLEEVCAAPHAPCRAFVCSHLQDLQAALLDSLKSAASPAKRPRLKCLFHIVKQLSAEHEPFVTALVPEVILCTKEVSVGARKNAFVLLVEMGHAFIRFGPTPQEAMQRFLLLVYAGLTGSVTMISCTVLALTRLFFEFKDHLELSVVEQLLQNVCLLLASRTRDVVKAALGFLKVTLLLVDTKLLAKHVQAMLEAVGNLSDDMRRHFRMKLRNLFTKFIRKFGFELVKGLLPAEYHKVLVNIRKAEARSRKQRALRQAAADTDEEEAPPAQPRGDSMEEILADSEDEEEEEEERQQSREWRKQARQKGQAWLKEGEDDEPLNFLDPNVSQRVLATKPGPKRSRGVSHDFQVSEDGRLIIHEEEEEVNDDEAKGTAWAGADEEMADVLQDLGLRSKKSQKRRFREEPDDEEPEARTYPQYRAGGSGIHRQLDKEPAFGAEYRSKKGKGDVKKKGQLDPYAYIPLNTARLNRRKRAKMQGQFKGLVKGAQRGAKAGRRNRLKAQRP
ncbi:RRP12-like protein isoform X1 [Aquila chrysaetos chrysaetos]|uniref:RRP12-like protein isoform X1 n=1 Tax=Aquila chrysaetos chrysaetos TaxID=223781 RepID=UPI001B7D30AC|nr:RRP12-like protein isoform X1 [Aquila chrysaetos chrysaetos]